MKFSYEELLRLRTRLAALDPLLVAAADEVDSTLLEWARNLASAALHRFQVEPPSKAG